MPVMQARPPGGSNKSVRKFSTFLKSVTIELDPELYPENGLIEVVEDHVQWSEVEHLLCSGIAQPIHQTRMVLR